MNPLRRRQLLALLHRGLGASASPDVALRAALDHERRWETAVAESAERTERVED
ncbi:hypothetical protein [Arenivirga flava]|uniref:Uncharacterized protein n=1 Tax=Arenivirga flava TaxID=1930060 RepID=A0AA37UE96_9MICO|nr:hypothetical protein [Arenivirga flava]GMA28659.1 hypothetical protein GCM10025874_19120 [Arenivirga flava]